MARLVTAGFADVAAGADATGGRVNRMVASPEAGVERLTTPDFAATGTGATEGRVARLVGVGALGGGAGTGATEGRVARLVGIGALASLAAGRDTEGRVARLVGVGNAAADAGADGPPDGGWTVG